MPPRFILNSLKGVLFMEKTLMDLVDEINQSVEDSECSVLEAMISTYTKSIMIMESCSDVSVFNNMFMESSGTYEDSHVRSQNIFAKFTRVIRRLWQQILTMVTNGKVKRSISNLKRNVQRSKDDEIPLPFNPILFKNDYKDIKVRILPDVNRCLEIFENDEKCSIESVLRVLDDFDKDINKLEIQSRDYNHKMSVFEFVSKKFITDWLDIYDEYFKALKDMAKRIDKWIDKIVIRTEYEDDKKERVESKHMRVLMHAEEEVSPNVKKSTKKYNVTGNDIVVNDELIKKLNNASTNIFKKLREQMTSFSQMIDKISEQYIPNTNEYVKARTDVLTMDSAVATMKKMLIDHRISKSSKEYGFVVCDLDHPEVKKSLMDTIESIKNDTRNEVILKPVPDYPTRVLIALYFYNGNEKTDKNWTVKVRCFHCKQIDDKLKTYMKKHNGLFVVGNN